MISDFIKLLCNNVCSTQPVCIKVSKPRSSYADGKYSRLPADVFVGLYNTKHKKVYESLSL